MAEKAYEDFLLEEKLKSSVENDEFYLLYQPQVRLSDNKLIGVEAFIRWRGHEDVSPSKFLPVAEQYGLIEKISDWVVEAVCKQISLWKNENIAFGSVAINLSRRELGKKNLFSRITNIVEKYDVNPSCIELDVTETAVFINRNRAFKNIKALSERGFLIAIDDFGTGYSSLSNLQEYLFDKLKIDRSFIRGINVKKESELIVKATIAIAKSLGLKVIAEGVETLEQLMFLRHYACDEVQGFYCSRPVLANKIPSLVNSTFMPAIRFDDYQI